MTDNKSKNIATVLRAAGHPLRVNILELIKGENEISVNEICSKLNLEQSLTSHHLNLLTKAGYIKGNRKGKFIFYSLASQELYNLLEIVKKQLNGLVERK